MTPPPVLPRAVVRVHTPGETRGIYSERLKTSTVLSKPFPRRFPSGWISWKCDPTAASSAHKVKTQYRGAPWRACGLFLREHHLQMAVPMSTACHWRHVASEMGALEVALLQSLCSVCYVSRVLQLGAIPVLITLANHVIPAPFSPPRCEPPL